MVHTPLNPLIAYVSTLSLQPLLLEVKIAGTLYGKYKFHRVSVTFYGVHHNIARLLEQTLFPVEFLVKTHVYHAINW